MLLCACTIPRTGIEATCDDGILNQSETDIDCGGTSCAPCGESLSCLADADCASRVCDRLDSNVCEQAGVCGNGMLEEGEACEDGNTGDGDGCNTDCLREMGEVCSLNEQCESEACDTLVSNTCVPPGVCGNGILEPGEGCDDGGRKASDGCNADCLKESGESCGGNNECASSICDATENPDRCEPVDTCGNSKLEGLESCDDGNTRGGDGCNSICRKEIGQTCSNDAECSSLVCDTTENPDVCEPSNSCGNGRIETDEVCDDGNTVAADGCSSECLNENGQTCSADDECQSGACDTMFTGRCVPVGECGNGILDPGESCEDGNIDPGDGCDEDCLRELGEPCGANDECGSGVCDQLDSGQCESADTCGNGVREPGEACDDGNTSPGDGCDDACLREDGERCMRDEQCTSDICDMSQVPSFCEPAETCGNGRVEEGEVCDDGDTAPGDGCSASCLLEDGETCADDADCDSGICDMTEPLAVCEPADSCGNGRLEDPEGCDDGGTTPGDGCSDTCLLEDGEMCSADPQCDSDVCDLNEEPPVCEPADTCGNGKSEGEEGCDDGNMDAGDGCNVFCFVENGFDCASDIQCQSGICDITETPPVCEPPDTCGNNRVETPSFEACDDGGVEPGDGCGSGCLLESGQSCDANWQCESTLCGLARLCV